MIAILTFPDLSPEIFSIDLFGMTLALRWYALAYIVGILIGWRIVVRAISRPELWRNDTPVMTRQQVEDLLFWVIRVSFSAVVWAMCCFINPHITSRIQGKFCASGRAECRFTAVPSA